MSLCEDAGHSLSGPWEAATSFKPPDMSDSPLTEGNIREVTDASTVASVSDSQDRCSQTFSATVPGSVARMHVHGPTLHCDSDCDAVQGVRGDEKEKGCLSCPTAVAIKCETPPPNTGMAHKYKATHAYSL